MDWDNDGNLDILSGCYWTEGAQEGQIQILRGQGALNFAAAESIKNAANETLCNIELADDAEREYDVRNLCTQQHAVDYDGDGDLDLVTGCIGSEFFYFENTADADDAATPDFARYGVPLEVASPSQHSNPHLVDWDGDGDLDLLSGTDQGGVFLSENQGTRSEPRWAKFKQLSAAAATDEFLAGGPAAESPAKCSRVWTVDWNSDGLLDLLVGDSVTIVSAKDGISAAEFQTRRAEYDRQMTEMTEQQAALVQSFGPDFDYASATEQQQTQLKEANEKWNELYQSGKEFMTARATGHIWLLIQKPKPPSVDEVAAIQQ